tara:strand:- start:271 stop:555 length:285 start_codon:yes stop_codon:yes gene_type:complete
MFDNLKDQLIELERLSINISDLIKDNKYENIVELDLRRQNIIKSINIEHAKDFKNELLGFFDNNNKQIKNIEEDISQLQKKSKTSLKCFKAYKN